MEWMRDPAWQFMGVIVAVVAIIATVAGVDPIIMVITIVAVVALFGLALVLQRQPRTRNTSSNQDGISQKELALGLPEPNQNSEVISKYRDSFYHFGKNSALAIRPYQDLIQHSDAVKRH
jgi:hypothetical protein